MERHNRARRLVPQHNMQVAAGIQSHHPGTTIYIVCALSSPVKVSIESVEWSMVKRV